jgi:uncharacterized small protein (DUF1192 family)
MNHPTPEHWMAHLYGEATETERHDLDAHLRACAECAAKVKSWRTGMHALDEWKLPQASPARHQSAWRWAAAAAVLVLGVVLGRYSMAREMDSRIAALRSEIHLAATESAGAETQKWLTDFATELDHRRGTDAASYLAALRQVDAQRSAEIARLRRDLGTVAVFADARLSGAEEQLYALAGYTPPDDPDPDDE